MKIDYNKAIYIALVNLFLLAQAHLSTSLIQNYFHKLDGIHYVRNCSLIDFAQKIRYAARLLYYHTVYSKSTLHKAFEEIEKELKDAEKILFEMEEEKLTCIKKKYSIEEQIWQRCLADIQKIKNHYKNEMLHAHSNSIKDSNVPADIVEILHVLLQQNDINPASISIVMAHQELAACNPGILANTIFQLPIYANNIAIDGEYIPATITIFPDLIKESLEEKISICAHEIQHLVLKHSLTKLIVLKYLAHYYSLDEQTIRQTIEFKQLDQIYEAQAEIIAATNNHHVSQCLNGFRKQHYYPRHLYEEHFYTLSTIDMLWNIHNKLEALYFT